MNNKKINVLLFKNSSIASEFVREEFVRQIHQKNNSVFGFATGTSPLELYKMLTRDHLLNRTNWSKIKSFNLDEFVGLDPIHPSSFVAQMKQNLFSGLNINMDNVHLPNGQANDLAKEANDYENLIVKNPIDLQFISLGANGHIAYNEPPCVANSKTHVVNLLPTTRHDLVTQGFFHHLDEVPIRAITMGIQTILSCKRIIMAVFGEHKQDVGKRMLEQPPCVELPASYLQNHSNCLFVFDELAADKLNKNLINIEKI